MATRSVPWAAHGGTAAHRPRTPLWVPALALIPGLVLIPIALMQDRPTLFFNDVFEVMDQPPFVGVISNLGAFAWCGTSTVCLFTALVLYNIGGAPRRILCLGWFGLLSGLLLIDDFFMLHDYVLWRYFQIRPELTVGALALLMLGSLFYFRRDLASLDWPILLPALGLFGLSAGVDLSNDLASAAGMKNSSWDYVAEDVPKFLGLLLWAAFFVRASWLSLMSPWPATPAEAAPDPRPTD